MTKEELGFWDFVKAAFHLKVPMKGLGHIPLNKLLLAGFAIIGIGHPGFWLLGLAYEVGYLLFLSGNPRFQNLVRGSRVEQDQQTYREREDQILAGLDPDSHRRYDKLVDRCQEVQRLAGRVGSFASLDDLKTGGMSQLLWIFLKLLDSRKRIKETLAKTSKEILEAEIKDLSDKVSKEPDNSAVYKTLKGTLEIQQRRLENIIKATESLKVTEAELDRIEKQVTLLVEETAVSSDPTVMSARLDGVMQSLQGTTQWMSQHAEFFGALDEDAGPQDLISGRPKIAQGG